MLRAEFYPLIIRIVVLRTTRTTRSNTSIGSYFTARDTIADAIIKFIICKYISL